MKENKASSTAFTVMQGVLYVAKNSEYKYLVSEQVRKVAETILSSSEQGLKCLKLLDSPWFLCLVPILESIISPGLTLHYVLRKRLIEDSTVAAINNNTVQVINLGAGLDTLAWRLHSQYPQVQFIEVDHPATIQLKTDAFLQAENKAENLHWLPVDFSRESLQEALQSFAAFDAGRKTLFICEGVLMYLHKNEVVQLLADIRKLTGTGTQCIFSCLEPWNSPKNNIRFLLKWYTVFKGESLQWTIEAEELPGFLHQQRYQLQKIADTETFKNTYLKTHSKHQLLYGEYIALTNIP